MSDKVLAQIARSMASHLIAFAHERREDDKKSVQNCQRELCEAYRRELEEKKEK